MSKQEKKGLVPELRFPEFQDKGGWDEDKLSELVTTVTPPKKLPTNLYQVEGLYPIIDQSQRYICGWTNDKESLISGHFPLIIFGDHTCILKIARGPFAQGADGIKILKAKDQVEAEFLYQALQVRPVVMEEYKRHFSILKERIVGFPEKESGEQQKIADCLTSIDELISNQTQKLDALKTHKKSLMQQIFPAEGETVPKCRFPEFRHAEEWEERFISDLGEIITGSTPSTTKPEYYGGDRLFVSPADISDQRFIEKTKTTLTELGFSETRPVKLESILFVCIGSTIGKIAQNHQECATNQQINAVVPSANYSNTFVYYSLENNSEKISGLAGNHAVPIINKTAFGAVEIRFPKLPEQQKIADCLASIDELIFNQTKKIEALKAHKKGLMQQLFPAIDEVDK
ncbi:MAG: restriction endonuclease subunit S [Methylobacter sp.]|nr:restriction endonuclease subunit S [Methylobacter sp.]